jgi:hypothetical protein
MTTKERIEIVNAVIETHDKLERAWEPAIKVFGTHDNALHEASWTVFDLYLDEMEKRMGDTFHWLAWHIYDNQCGDRGLEAKASNWKKARKIDSASMLVKLIEADLE